MELASARPLPLSPELNQNNDPAGADAPAGINRLLGKLYVNYEKATNNNEKPFLC